MPIPAEILDSHNTITGKIDKLFDHESCAWAEGIIPARHIEGFSWDKNKQGPGDLYLQIRQLYAGLSAVPCEVVYCLRGEENRVSISLGSTQIASVESCLKGVLEDAVLSDDSLDMTAAVRENHYGMVTGMPPVPADHQGQWHNPVNMIVQGMMGCRYSLIFRCRPTTVEESNLRQSDLRQRQDDAESNMQFTQPVDRYHTMARTYTVSAAGRYKEYLQKMISHIEDARYTGLWRVIGYYSSDEPGDMRRLAALIRAAFGAENSGPDPISCADVQQMPRQWQCTLLSGSQVAAFCMLPDMEVSGFYLNQRAIFDRTPRRAVEKGLALGRIVLSPYCTEEMMPYCFSYPDLDRHALIVGATGGGKTNTVKSLLTRLYGDLHIPFLVIESAKSEYWQLSALPGFEKICAFPLGKKEDCSFYLNPFECLEKFPLQTHVDSLLSTFNAAFEMYPPMPFLLEQAVYRVYEDWGWDITTGKNRFQKAPWPTLSDLYDEIPVTVERSAYDREIKNNVTGSLQTRIRSLMIGGKGTMLDVPVSTDFTELLRNPAVMELENLGDDNTKTFVMGLLMNRLYEYRRANMETDELSKSFNHLLIIEEAHRLLKNVMETEGNQSRTASVEFFCNMLAEIRSYGQGILIADQSPTKLARDAIRNTNLKIVHRIVDSDDRNAVGGAMHMTDDQISALSVLKRGVGAVYAEGDHQPLLVKFPLIKSQSKPDRKKALECAAQLTAATHSEMSACALCPSWNGKNCTAGDTRTEAERIAGYLTDRHCQNAQSILEKYNDSGEIAFSLVEYAVSLTLKEEYSVDRILTDEWPAEKVLCCGRQILDRVLQDPRRETVLIRRLYRLLLNNLRRPGYEEFASR